MKKFILIMALIALSINGIAQQYVEPFTDPVRMRNAQIVYSVVDTNGKYATQTWLSNNYLGLNGYNSPTIWGWYGENDIRKFGYEVKYGHHVYQRLAYIGILDASNSGHLYMADTNNWHPFDCYLNTRKWQISTPTDTFQVQNKATEIITQYNTLVARLDSIQVFLNTNKLLFNTSNLGIYIGSGNPTGTITAPVGSIFINKSHSYGVDSAIYFKNKGTDANGWVGVKW